MANNQIQFGIGFKVDESGLKNLRTQLESIQKLTVKDLTPQFGDQAAAQLTKTKEAASRVEQALNKAFNVRLNSLNITQFNKELQKSGYTSQTLAQSLAAAGTAGVRAFNDITAKSLSLNTSLKQTSGFLSKMGETLSNTIRWNLASSAINGFTSAIRGAFSYVESLDRSLTSIRVVTGDSREEMAKFAVEANNAAQALGRQTKEYTNAALTFYQQGLTDEEVRIRTEAVLKAQNITNSGSEMADYLTAVWNGFKVTAEETTLYVDKLAAVADSSASDMSELAIAMSKVASTANNMGVTIDQLTAQIATIVATTRVAPETVGNALKTIYARINDIKSGSDEAEISLGQYTGRMKSLGINVLDMNGRLRDSGDVMTEIGEKWSTMTREQQIYLAQTMAGQRQMNNLVSLFDNWRTYTNMLNTSLNATGTLEEKNARYLDSIEAHLKAFKAAIEGFQDSLIDEQVVKSIYDLGTGFFNFAKNIIDAIGGMRGAILGLGVLLTNVLGDQIANSVAHVVQGWRDWIDTNEDIARSVRWVKEQYADLALEIEKAQKQNNQGLIDSLNYSRNKLASMRQETLVYTKLMTNEQRAQYNTLLNEQKVHNDNLILLKEQLDTAKQYYDRREMLRVESYGMQATNRSDIYSFDPNAENGVVFNISEEQRNNITSMVDVLDDLHATIQDNIVELENLTKQFSKLGENGISNLSRLEVQYNEIQKKIKEPLAKIGTNNADWYVKNYLSEEDQQNYFNFKQIKADATDYFEQLQVLANKKVLGPHTDEIQKIIKNINGNQLSLSAGLKAVARELNITEDQLGHAIETLRTADEAQQKWKNSVEQTSNSFELFKTALSDQAFGKAISGFSQGLSQILFGISTLANIPKTLKQIQDGSISMAQGFLQMSRSLLMGLTSTITGVGKFTDSLDILLEKGPDVIHKLLELIATRILDAKATNLESRAKAKEIAATGAEKVAHEAVTEAITKENMARAANAQLVGFITNTLLPYVAGLAAVAATVYTVYKVLNAENEELTRLQDNLQETRTSYGELKEKYEEVKTGFDEYQGMVDATQQIRVGTAAWYDAIDGVNDKVQDLISQYPQLIGYLEESNGQLSISQEGWDHLLEQQKQQKDIARGKNVAANIAVNNQNNRIQAQQIQRAASIATGGLGWISIDDVLKTAQLLHQDINLTQAYLDNNTQQLQEYAHQIGLADANELKAILAQTAGMSRLRDSVAATTKSNERLKVAYLKEIHRENELFKDMSLEAQDAIFKIAARKMSLTIESSNAEITQDVDKYGFAAQNNLTYHEQFNENGSLGGYFTDNKTGQRVAVTDEQLREYREALNAELSDAELEQAKQQYLDIISYTKDPKVQQRILNYRTEGVAALNELTESQFHSRSTYITEHANDFVDVNSKKFEQHFASAWKRITDQWEEEGFTEVFNSLNINSKAFTIQQGDNLTKFAKQFKEQFGIGVLNELLLTDELDLTHLADQIDSPLSAFTDLDDYINNLTQGAELTDRTNNALRRFLATRRQELGLYDDYANTYDLLNNLKGSITGVNSEVEEKVIAQLQEMGVDTTQYFGILANGMYGFFGNIEEFQRLLNDLSLKPLENKILDLLSLDYATALQSNDKEAMQTKADYLVDRGVISEELANIYLNGNTWQRFWGQKTINKRFADQNSNDFNAWVTNDAYSEDREKLANSAANLEELMSYYREGAITAEQYAKAVELVARREGLNADEVRNIATKYREKADVLDYVDDKLKDNYELSANIAAINEDVIEGVSTLQSKWSEWSDNLNEGLDSTEGINALYNLSTLLTDMFNTEIDTDFVAEHLTEIKRLAEGDLNAIYDLQKALATTDLEAIRLDHAEFDEDFLELENLINNTDFENIEIGASVEDRPFYQKLKEMVDAGAITADQANRMLSKIGYTPEIKYKTLNVGDFAQVGSDHYHYEGEAWNPATGQMETITYDLDSEQISKLQSEPIKIPYIVANDKGLMSGGVYTNAVREAKRHPTKTGGKKSGGGSKKPKKQEAFKAKIDPYHDVNIKLKDNEQTLKNLQKQQEKTYGGAALSNLLKQVEVLSKERDLLKEKFDINVRELHNQQEQLKSYGATFDALGRISNYESLLLSKQEEINRLINQYNAMRAAGADDDALQAINDRISALKEEYSTVESLISEYDNASDQLQALYDEATEDLEKALEKVQTMFTLPIEIGLEIQTREKDWLEFKRDIVDRVSDDNFLGQIEVPLRNMNLVYNDEGTGMAQQIAPILQTAMQELRVINNGGFSTIFGTDQVKARETVKKLYKDATQQLENYYEQLEKTQDIYLDTINAMKDAFDEQLQGYDRITDTIEQDLKLVELLNGEDNYVMFQRLYDQQHANDQQRVDMRRLQLRVLKQELAEQKRLLNTAEKGTKEYQRLEEQYKNLQEQTVEAFQNLNEFVQKAVESAASAWENAMKAMRQQTDQAFFGDRYLFDQMWEYTDWHEDTYLDPLEKANKLLDLQLEFNKEINDANEKNRRNLVALRDKILERLQAQEHIRESDLELAQRELDVAKAQMALEDARNTKTTMRLRRDSQGNYTYQYVADADNIADRLKDYRDAMEKYRQLAMDTVKDIRKELYAAYDESQDKLYEFMEKYRNEIDGQSKALRAWREWMRSDEGKVTLIAEDLVRRLEAIRKSTRLELQGMDRAIGTEELLKQMGVDQASAFGQALTEMIEQAGPDIWDTLINGNTEEVTRILEDKLLGIVDQFDGMYGSAIDQMATDPETTQANMTEMAERADAYAAQYRESLEQVEALSGTVFDAYAEGADQALQFNVRLIQDNETLTSGYQELAETLRNDVAAALEELTSHKPEIDALSDSIEDAVTLLNSVDLSQYGDLMTAARQAIAATQGLQYSDDELAVRITTNSAAGLNSSIPTYDTRVPETGTYDTTAVTSETLRNVLQNYDDAMIQYQNSINEELQKMLNGEFSTVYGTDISAAQQALTAASMQRYNQYIVDQLANIDSNMLDTLAAANDFLYQTTGGDNILNQDVHIDASFPNVQSAAEIERAFNNLVNLASQRANANKRRNNG